jgi:plasmid stabilization system protein ParE
LRLRWHREARRDAEEAATFYEDRSEGLGDEFLDELDAGLSVILDAPERWPTWRGTPPELEVRKYRIKRFPYAIAYV